MYYKFKPFAWGQDQKYKVKSNYIKDISYFDCNYIICRQYTNNFFRYNLWT